MQGHDFAIKHIWGLDKRRLFAINTHFKALDFCDFMKLSFTVSVFLETCFVSKRVVEMFTCLFLELVIKCMKHTA